MVAEKKQGFIIQVTVLSIDLSNLQEEASEFLYLNLWSICVLRQKVSVIILNHSYKVSSKHFSMNYVLKQVSKKWSNLVGLIACHIILTSLLYGLDTKTNFVTKVWKLSTVHQKFLAGYDLTS